MPQASAQHSALQLGTLRAFLEDAALAAGGETGERLLSVEEAAARLGMSRRTFERACVRLRARGLEQLQVGPQRKYTASSISALIRRCVERAETLTGEPAPE